MANYTRLEVANVMKETGLVPLFYNADLELSKKVIKAVYDGGARLLEFTARGDFAHEVFGELNKYVIKELPGLIMGVGSVTDAASASRFMALGANFIVTPVLREDIALVCNRRKVLWSPGCGSLTEICKAEELGCEIVKLFPGGVYGPGFVKAIKGPQSWTSIMPTGGVAPTNCQKCSRKIRFKQDRNRYQKCASNHSIFEIIIFQNTIEINYIVITVFLQIIL